MSTQAAVVEQPALSRREASKRPLAGAWLLSGAMVVSGILTYAFHILAARTLGAHAYGQIAVLWAAMFLVAVVIFRPLEQTTSRAVADRLARHEEVESVLRSVGVICAAVLAAGVVVAVVGWGTITERLFLGNDTLTVMLFAGAAMYGLAYLVRGVLAGARWFNGYGLGLVADAVARLALAVPLVFAASQNWAGAAVAAAGLAGALVPLYFGRGRLRSIFTGSGGSRFRLGAALTFAAPASVIAAADQLLVNGGPLLVILGSGKDASKTAGVVFAATMLVRAPVFVFQGVAAALLPNLTRLHAVSEAASFRRAVARTACMLLATGGVIVGLAAAFGPQAMRLLYGEDFEAGRLALTLLGAGVGCYLCAATFSQALLALDNGTRAAAGWAGCALLFVAVYAILPGDELTRISVAFAVASLAQLLVLGGLLFQKVLRT